MKVEGFFFLFISVFAAVSDLVYWLMSHDPTGTTCLALSAGLAGICAFYLLFTGSRMDPRPEDLPDAEVSDGAGVVAHFSPASPWPVGIGFGVALAVLGFIFGLWLAVFGFGIMVITIVGLLFEYVRGPRLAHEDLVP